MSSNFNDIMLRTAFSCMSCDGDIATEEVSLISEMAEKEKLFGDVEIKDKLQELLSEINAKGSRFLKEYLSSLQETKLSVEQKLSIMNVAYKTILADKKIEYSEVKFFKVIRSVFEDVPNELIMETVAGIEDYFLEEDINSEFGRIYEAYFKTEDLKPFPVDALVFDNKKSN